MTPDDILSLEQRRITAMLSGDIEALDRLLRPEAVWVHASSKEDDKPAFLDGFRQGRLVAHSLALSDQAVHVYGNVGLCHGTVVMDASMDGKRLTATHRFTTVWVGEGGVYRLAIYQATASSPR
jgi:ketosteroid isomerase-like protein